MFTLYSYAKVVSAVLNCSVSAFGISRVMKNLQEQALPNQYLIMLLKIAFLITFGQNFAIVLRRFEAASSALVWPSPVTQRGEH